MWVIAKEIAWVISMAMGMVNVALGGTALLKAQMAVPLTASVSK